MCSCLLVRQECLTWRVMNLLSKILFFCSHPVDLRLLDCDALCVIEWTF